MLVPIAGRCPGDSIVADLAAPSSATGNYGRMFLAGLPFWGRGPISVHLIGVLAYHVELAGVRAGVGGS